MLNLVFETTAVFLCRVPPVVFRDELTLRPICWRKACTFGLDSHGEPFPSRTPRELGSRNVAVGPRVNMVRHWHTRVLLVEDPSGHCGYGAFRHQLANENNASLLTSANIEADVNLLKVLVERDAKTEDACAVELETDQANVGLACERIEFSPGGNERVKQ